MVVAFSFGEEIHAYHLFTLNSRSQVFFRESSGNEITMVPIGTKTG